MKRIALGLAGLVLVWASGAWAACPTTSLTFKDAAGTTQTLCFGGASGAFIPQYQILDAAGTNALTVTAAGAAKVDNSAVTQPISGTITANAGTNLNTSTLALEAGGNLAQHTTDFGAPGAVACTTDTGSCNFNQLFQRIAQRLTTVNTTLGTPAQAGGTVTANAGTNLNTSLLALEGGGNLAQLVTDSGAPGAVACATDTASCNFNQLLQRLAQRLTTINTTLGTPLQAGGTIAGTVTANAGTNLNTSALALEAGGNLAQHTTDFGAPGATACATDTASCNFNQLLQRLAQRLTTINTTLASPFQAGGALAAHQSTNVDQLNGTTLVTGGVNGTLAIGGNQAAASVISTNTNPVLIGGSDYGGTPKIQTFKVDSTGLGYINCQNCSGSGLAQTDEGAFTPGSVTSFAQGGGFFQTTATNNALTNLTFGAFQLTANRALFTNLRNASGAEVGIAATPLQVSIANTGTNATPVQVSLANTAANATPVTTSLSGATPAGTNIIGNVRIDQTTDVTTNGVEIAPTASSNAGISPIVSAAGEASHVLKAGAGNLYSVYATNLTNTAGFLVVVNATSAPADGAITPLDCVPLAGSGNAAISYNPGPPKVYSTGITAVVTSATTCFTKTTGVITAFISGSAK